MVPVKEMIPICFAIIIHFGKTAIYVVFILNVYSIYNVRNGCKVFDKYKKECGK